MNIFETVILGVVSGVITAAFLYLISLFFINHFIPWYQKTIYKGVDISGTWVAEVTSASGITASMEMTIHQNGHSVKGESTIVQGRDPSNLTQVSNLSMSGHIWEGFITLNQQSKDRTRLSYSTSLLQVLNGGIRLNGVYCFLSIITDKIESLEIKWVRKEQNSN